MVPPSISGVVHEHRQSSGWVAPSGTRVQVGKGFAQKHIRHWRRNALKPRGGMWALTTACISSDTRNADAVWSCYPWDDKYWIWMPTPWNVSASLSRVRWRRATQRFFLIARSPSIAWWCGCLSLIWSSRDFASHIKLLAELVYLFISNSNASEIFIWLRRLAWSILDMSSTLSYSCHHQSETEVALEVIAGLRTCLWHRACCTSWRERHGSTNRWRRLRFEMEELSTIIRSQMWIYF